MIRVAYDQRYRCAMAPSGSAISNPRIVGIRASQKCATSQDRIWSVLRFSQAQFTRLAPALVRAGPAGPAG